MSNGAYSNKFCDVPGTMYSTLITPESLVEEISRLHLANKALRDVIVELRARLRSQRKGRAA